jgi:hypothetical protein
MTVKGQRHVWWGPAQLREHQRRRELKREATKLLADDRRRLRATADVSVPKSAVPEPVSRNGWMPLSDLPSAMRAKLQEEKAND